eukprot:TRINITY_DN7429_c0_g1_i2.p1 TRINITY_DN7429_c0_g1~~TRINITY_DN7429_c0_g1_i2.p1  ORF type:complete len:180 (-),score=30.35 TRINITY_DN7429_c0_g1_i2:530-1069(-)
MEETQRISSPTDSEWIRLNVGGMIIQTSRSTLLRDPHSMLFSMFGNPDWVSRRDDTGAYLIDQEPRYFLPLLNFLRYDELIIDAGVDRKGVLAAAKYFQISAVISQLEDLVPIGKEEDNTQATIIVTYGGDSLYLSGEKLYVAPYAKKFGFQTLEILFTNSWYDFMGTCIIDQGVDPSS